MQEKWKDIGKRNRTQIEGDREICSVQSTSLHWRRREQKKKIDSLKEMKEILKNKLIFYNWKEQVFFAKF